MSKSIKEWQQISHAIAVEKGWYAPPKTFTEMLMLMVSELAEALEEHRNNMKVTSIYYDSKTGKPEGVPIELADLLIRAFDAAEFYGIDLEAAIEIKTEYNRSRERRHGGKTV
jgi:NTP pyrophosphatase (non-canonical NTP hydrolase)